VKQDGPIGFAMRAGIACLATCVVQASPITYDVVTGSSSNLELFASNANTGTTLLSGGVIPMTSGSLIQFDAAALTLPTQDFDDTGPTLLALTGALQGDSLEITSFTVMPTTGYTSSVTSTGANSYNFNSSDLLASGNWQLLNSSLQPVTGQSGTINHTITSFNGQFTMSGNMMEDLTLTGISLGQVTIESTPVNLSADVEFTGMAVPLPPAFWLFGSGLLGVLLARGRTTSRNGRFALA
jgi:hypothetical protein